MMPICPNCGSYVDEGSHTCQCGTSFSYDSTVKVDGVDDVDDRMLAREMLDRLAQNHVDEARRLEKEGRFQEAIERCLKALEMNYKGSTLELIAGLYNKTGDYEKSLYYYNRLRMQNDSFKVYLSMGTQQAELGRYDDAFENFNHALEKINESSRIDDESRGLWIARAYNEIGWAYNLMGSYDKAIENYEKGIGYCHDYAGNWNCKAIALDSQRKYVEALKFYDIALTINAGDKTIMKNRRECLENYAEAYDSGEYTVKSEYLDEAMKLSDKKFKGSISDHPEEKLPYVVIDFDED